MTISNFFHDNIIKITQENIFYRKELMTGTHSQIVLMNIQAGEEIGEEVHQVDQILFFVQGKGQAILKDKTFEVFKDDLVFVPAGTKHNFKNNGTELLKLFTIYAPAEHKRGTVEKYKPEEK